MSLKLPHIPRLTILQCEHLNGVYRSKKTDDIAVFKNVRRKGFVGEDNQPFDAYVVNFNSVNHGKIKNCMVDLDEWVRVLSL